MSDAINIAPSVRRRRWLRRVLLLVVPALAVAVGVGIYLQGGRYISTDNAYVAAQKVLVTPQISGTVNDIKVAERAEVNALYNQIAWNAGVTYALTDNIEAELRYYATDADVPGEQYADSLVAGLSLAF